MNRFFACVLILIVGATRDRNGADDATAFYDRQRAASRHDPALARYDQTVKPGIAGDFGQFLGRLLETRRRVGLVKCDLDRDRARLVHASECDHSPALIDNHGRHGDIELCRLGVGISYHLDCFFSAAACFSASISF